ncbi:MAG: hypothetical protein QOH21_3199 [Acidobacteriota bacterium]|nr:hypothetical protein [Acidobacteriota bacterium]
MATALHCARPAAVAAPTQPTQPAPPAQPAAVSAEELVDHSGDSLMTAIAVPADAPDAGVDFQNNWIFDRYGRFRRTGGGTGSSEGRRYNVVKIELASGERKTVYFDITENWARSQQQ